MTNEIRPRNKPRTDLEIRRRSIVEPKIPLGSLFSGWGPKLMALALAIGAAGVTGRPADAGTALADLACNAPDRDAIVLSAPAPEFPDYAQVAGDSGEAVIRVELSASGHVQHTELASSTGDFALDREANRIARESSYAPAMAHCENVASTFLYQVNFTQ